MKKKISQILGVVLTLALLSVFFVAAPVLAQPGENAWEEIDMPPVEPETDVGPMAIDPNDADTIYAAIQYYDDIDYPENDDGDEAAWKVVKSEDGGHEWSNTTLVGLDAYDTGNSNTDILGIVDIVVSTDGTVYVACLNGDIFRLEGNATPILLKEIVDSAANTLGDVDLDDLYTYDGYEYWFWQGLLYDIDVWNDGSDNWIMAACTLDVLVLKDALFEDWRDQELSTSYDEYPWYFTEAFQCAFAPDFTSTSLIWAIVGIYDDDYWSDSVLMITATNSPGQWGWLVDEVIPENIAGNAIEAGPFVEMDFPTGYDSDIPYLYAALSGGRPGYTTQWTTPRDEPGNLFLCNMDYNPDDSEAIPLLDEDIDVRGVQVYGEVILATANDWPTVFRSDNGGGSFDIIGWDPFDLDPEGQGPTGWGDNWSWIGLDDYFYSWTHVYMAPGAFDTDEGVAYVSTLGAESAVSKSVDGGVNWRQIAWIDTEIDDIPRPAIAFGSTRAVLATDAYDVEDYYGHQWDTSSLWLTADITTEDPVWERVLCASENDYDMYTFNLPGNFDNAEDFDDVAWAQDGSDTIMLHGDKFFQSPHVYRDVIWKSSDGGNTFSYWRTLPGDIDRVRDWVVLDGATVFMATDDGFYGIRLIGPALQGLDGESLWSIALQPGFGNSETIIVGDNSGNIFVSDDAGATWGDAQPVDDDDNGGPDVAYGRIYVAFDADFAVEDAAGEGLIYFVGSGGGNPGVAEVSGTGLSGIDELLDDTWGDPAYDPNGYTGIVVARDGDERNALYAMEEDGELVRLLLHEDLNLWEEAGTEAWLNNPDGLYFSSGSNILWTIDGNDIWALEDTLAGPVTGLVVGNETETTADVEWNAMTGAEWYEVEWDSAVDWIKDTEGTIILLDNNTAYDVRVRVATQDDEDSPWSSRWSALESFITLETIFAPDNLVPYNGMQDAPLLPSFVWEHYVWGFDEYWFPIDESNAEHYEFQLSTIPTYTVAGFTSGIVEQAIIDAPTNAYTCGTELAYDTNHYWIVRAVSTDSLSGEWAYSDWCFSNFHTRTEEIPQVTVEPPPTPTITVIQPTPTVTVIPPDVLVTVVPPDITVDIPQPTITTVQTTIEMPEEITPAYIWAIVAIGALLVIAVIILIIRTRRVV